MKIKVSEHAEQSALIKWAWLRSRTVAELSLLHAVPNGGLRDRITARRMVEEGVLPGIPDLCLPVARNGWNSLYIEMKSKGGRPTEAQKIIHGLLREAGNCVQICHSWGEAARALENYIGCKRTV